MVAFFYAITMPSKKDPSVVKRRDLHVYCSDEIYQLFKEAAAADDLPVSSWVKAIGVPVARYRLGLDDPIMHIPAGVLVAYRRLLKAIHERTESDGTIAGD